MKALFAATIVMALAATAGLAFMALRNRPGGPSTTAPEPAAAAPQQTPPPDRGRQGPRPEPRTLRRYQTTASLAEDLRDALAGKPQELQQEWRRVSGDLATKARWTLDNLAPFEASPRVRALLVLAAGVHLPDEEVLLAFLDDREAVVRHAAALATGYRPAGTRKRTLIEGLEVALGRRPAAATRQRLERRRAAEQDPAVRAGIEAVLADASRRR